jgi:ATP-binding cassette subfamily B protein
MSDTYYEEEEFESQFNGQTVMRVLAQGRPYWHWMVGFVVSIGLVSVLDAYFTFLSKRIIDEGIVARNRAVLMEIVTQYGGLILVQAVFVLAMIYLTGVLGERIRYDLRQKIFNHLQELSLSYYSRTPVGWIMSRVTSDTDRIAELITWGILDSSFAILNIMSSAYFMLRINARLAMIVLATIPVLVVVAIQFRKRILAEYRQVRKMNSKITGAYNENITGVRVVKALGREDENMQEFSGLTKQMYRAGYRAAWLSALFLPTVQIISAFAVGAIVYFSGQPAMLGEMSIGGIQAFVSYITFMMWPIQDLARVYAEMQQAIASAERMFSLIDSVPEVQDQPGAVDPGSLTGEIVFEDVDFYYDNDKPVLSGFNLRVKPGETIALVGPTGGGKSTIVNLVCRFYEPKQGAIRIHGKDYREYSLHGIQSRIGVVLQTPHLFSGTIRENIAYGRLEAIPQEIEEAAQLAGAHEFIAKFPKGYEEQVGEGGNMLSTGQKQLISLARAVLAQPEIFVMDEATSSVDTITEALIQRGMENLMKGRTSFVIAHRLSTIKRASRILVIEDGKIAEMGTHAELLRKQGHYYRLYTKQFRHQLEQEYDLGRLTGGASPAPAGD